MTDAGKSEFGRIQVSLRTMLIGMLVVVLLTSALAPFIASLISRETDEYPQPPSVVPQKSDQFEKWRNEGGMI